MRSIFLGLVFSLFMIGTASAANDPVMCTMEYAPVCGSVVVQCVTAPCDPIRETFGNLCMANAAGATAITTGECKDPVIVGGDSDEYGCKASAGYSWDESLAQCIRIWEKPQMLVNWAHDNALTRYQGTTEFGYDRALSRQEAAAIITRSAQKIWGLKYSSFPEACNRVYSDESSFDGTLKNDIYSACALGLMYGQDTKFSPERTLSRAEALVSIMRGVDGGKKDESGSVWYAKYAERAQSFNILSSLDTSGFEKPITRGELIEWIYSASHSIKIKTSLSGTWTLDSALIDTMMLTGAATVTFEDGSYSAKFCNTIFSAYNISGNVLSAKAEASTKMACPESHLAIMENAWSLDKAKYTISGNTLVITMGQGGIYTFHREVADTEIVQGEWTLQEFNSKKITDKYTLDIKATSISAKFCNNMFGDYSMNADGKFSAPALASTMMYCEGLSMTLESAFALDGASYSVYAVRLAEGVTGPTMFLNITTQKGDVFLYGR